MNEQYKMGCIDSTKWDEWTLNHSKWDEWTIQNEMNEQFKMRWMNNSKKMDEILTRMNGTGTGMSELIDWNTVVQHLFTSLLTFVASSIFSFTLIIQNWKQNFDHILILTRCIVMCSGFGSLRYGTSSRFELRKNVKIKLQNTGKFLL
jgi:hypothetical protein